MCNTIPNFERHCYRCVDCLSVVFVDGPKLPATGNAMRSYGECGVCGGDMEHMGGVFQERLADISLRCACDARCTNAKGPSCNCKCGGANHGTGAVVIVIRDKGSIKFPATGDAEECRTRAEEYRLLVALVSSCIANEITKKRAGQYLAAAEYNRFYIGSKAIAESRKLRLHSARVRLLEKAIAKLQ